MHMSGTSMWSFSLCCSSFPPLSHSLSSHYALLSISLVSFFIAWRMASLESTEAKTVRALQSKTPNWHNITPAYSINYRVSLDSKGRIENDSPSLQGISCKYREESNRWQLSLGTVHSSKVRMRKEMQSRFKYAKTKPGISLAHRRS